MSLIITKQACKHCNYEFEQYVSFGHPEEDFDFKWECPKCKKENIERLHSLYSFEVRQRDPPSDLDSLPSTDYYTKFLDKWAKSEIENINGLKIEGEKQNGN